MKDRRDTPFSHNLRLLFSYTGLMQKEVAERSGTSENTMTWWKTGRSVPSREKRNALVDIFKEAVPGLELDADSIAFARLTERDLRDPLKGGLEKTALAVTNSGLVDLENDRALLDLLKITDREWETLRSITWPSWYLPKKSVFLEILRDYRNNPGGSKTGMGEEVHS